MQDYSKNNLGSLYRLQQAKSSYETYQTKKKDGANIEQTLFNSADYNKDGKVDVADINKINEEIKKLEADVKFMVNWMVEILRILGLKML